MPLDLLTRTAESTAQQNVLARSATRSACWRDGVWQLALDLLTGMAASTERAHYHLLRREERLLKGWRLVACTEPARPDGRERRAAEDHRSQRRAERWLQG